MSRREDLSNRRSRRLIPDSVPTESLPGALVEDGEPLTLGEASSTYMRINQHLRNASGRTSEYEYATNQYARILRADRHFQHSWGGLTTVMLTRTVSPFSDSGELLTPFEIEEMLNGAALRRSVREALEYHLGDFTFEWAAVTTPNTRTGTPYELIYLWVDDPDNEVVVGLIEPALQRHLDRCPNAYPEDHQYRADGSDGTIEIQHDPPRAELEAERQAEIMAEDDIPPYDQTAGALHLATNLPALELADYYDSTELDPPPTLIEGAAAGWACRAIRSHNWVRFSGGVPGL